MTPPTADPGVELAQALIAAGVYCDHLRDLLVDSAYPVAAALHAARIRAELTRAAQAIDELLDRALRA